MFDKHVHVTQIQLEHETLLAIAREERAASEERRRRFKRNMENPYMAGYKVNKNDLDSPLTKYWVNHIQHVPQKLTLLQVLQAEDMYNANK